MSDATLTGVATPAKRSLIYDPKARAVFFQAVLLITLIAFFVWIIGNTVTNLAAQGKKSGFGFLSESAGFAILPTFGTWFIGFSRDSSYMDIFLIGIANTFIVSILGIIAATILGFLMGVMRLSKNFVLRSFATVYVETLRNIPLLLQLFFWYFGVLRAMPGTREKWSLLDTFHINITGLWAPMPLTKPGFWMTALAFGAGLVLAWVIGKWARARQATTGQQFPSFWVGLTVIILLPLLVFYATGSPMEWQHPLFNETGPVLKRGFQKGMGMVLVPEMLAVWLALTLYTASFIAEIVRAGILAVDHGQTEASHALGLRQGQNLRLVVIPQALRVIIPPLTSQYLNLTKNSSLAVAIAYPELVSVFAGTALSQVGQEIEVIFMMMLVYLTFSLLISLFMNWYNERIKLVER